MTGRSATHCPMADGTIILTDKTEPERSYGHCSLNNVCLRNRVSTNDATQKYDVDMA